MNDDMDYIEYGQWVWQAMNEFDRIKLKINNHQFEIFSGTMQSLMGYRNL